jgi:hypothetical protein
MDETSNIYTIDLIIVSAYKNFVLEADDDTCRFVNKFDL